MIGTQEIVIIVIIALIVFGPQKMPEIGRQIGQMMREFRKMSGEVQSALNLDGDDHNYNRYDNGYGSAYKAEPPGPLVSAPAHGETYGVFPPVASDDYSADAADHNPYASTHETYNDGVADDDGQGARLYAAPADGVTVVAPNDHQIGSDAVEATSQVSGGVPNGVSNHSSGDGH